MADKTVTVKASGGTYTNLPAAISGEVTANADLTAAGMNGSLTIECYGIEDTAGSAVVNGFTTDASHRVIIKAVGSDRAGATWSTSKYRLNPTNAVAISVQDGYVDLDGLQITCSSPSTTGKHVVGVNTGAIELRILNCLLRGHGHGTHTQDGIYCNLSGLTMYLINSIIYNVAAITNNDGIVVNGATAYIYSSNIIGGNYALYRFGGTVHAKNTYCGGSATADFQGTITKTNCASEDSSADGTNPETGIAYSTANFSNVTAGSEDFALVAGSGLIDQGVDTSGESAPLNFTTDMLGVTRSGTWEIGPLEYASAAGQPRMVRAGGL